MANYVKGRLKERSVPELIVRSFVELYAQHPDLYLVQQPSQTQSGDEATIFFVTEPSWFKGWVDIDAPDDPYDECMWEESLQTDQCKRERIFFLTCASRNEAFALPRSWRHSLAEQPCNR
eukprot:UN2341